MPDPPYYIRTFAADNQGRPDRSASGRSYTLRVHQHLCRSPMDACALEPGLARQAPYKYLWPTTVQGDPLTELRTLFWCFKASGVKDGQLRAGMDVFFPDLKMQVEASATEPYDCITQTAPELLEFNDGMLPTQLIQTIPFDDIEIDPDDHDWDNDGIRDDLRVAPDLPGKIDDEMQIYFLKLSRASSFQYGFNVCNPSLTSFVAYNTDLTYLVPLWMQAFAELDDDPLDDDDLRAFMGFDATGLTVSPPASASVDLILDAPDDETLHGYNKLQGYYVSDVWPTFLEKDEGDVLRTWPDFEAFKPIPTLSPWEHSNPSDIKQFSDGGNPDSADYYYVLHYARCHRKEAHSCANPTVNP